MNANLKSTLLFFGLFLQEVRPAFAQPVRLWSYAKYRKFSPANTQLVDTGRFTYSGGRGLIIDSVTDTRDFFLSASPEEYANVNPWYIHPYQPQLPRVVAQFDSFQSWVYQNAPSPPGLKPYLDLKKFHTTSVLDSFHLTFASTNTRSSFRYLYDLTGKPIACQLWIRPSSSDPWTIREAIILTRNTIAKLIRREHQLYSFSGGYVWSQISTYLYDAQGLLDTVTVADSMNGTLSTLYHELFNRDALGRLSTVTQQHFTSGMLSYRDSFCYSGTSNSCTDIYRFLDTTLSHHYTYTYDADGRLKEHSVIENGATSSTHRWFKWKADGFIKQMNEVIPGLLDTVKTYYYYDSLGATGVNENQAMPATIEVYPNPATSILNIRYKSNSSETALLHINDLVGRKALHAKLRVGETLLDIAQLPSGIYLWHFSENGLQKTRGKFVKE